MDSFPLQVSNHAGSPRLETPLTFGIRDIMLYIGSMWPQTPCNRRPGSFKGRIVPATLAEQCGSLVGQPMLHLHLIFAASISKWNFAVSSIFYLCVSSQIMQLNWNLSKPLHHLFIVVILISKWNHINHISLRKIILCTYYSSRQATIHL